MTSVAPVSVVLVQRAQTAAEAPVARPPKAARAHRQIKQVPLRRRGSRRPRQPDPGALPCEADPELFFPPSYSGEAMEQQIRHAKATCGRCPQLVTCLELAVSMGEDEGIWGATTPGERRQMRVASRRVRSAS